MVVVVSAAAVRLPQAQKGNSSTIFAQFFVAQRIYLNIVGYH